MRLVLFGLAASLFACGSANAERLTNTAIGLSIEKPADWCVLSAEAVAQDHKTIVSANPQMRDVMGDDSYTPLYAFTRSDGSNRRLAITVKVGMRSATRVEAISGQQVLEETLRSIVGLMKDVKVVTAPETVRLAGKQAGHLAVTYKINALEAPLSIASEMWVIRRDTYFVLVGTTYPLENSAADRAAAMSVINSLRLTN